MALSYSNDIISVNIEFQEFILNSNSGFCKQLNVLESDENVLNANKRSNLCDEDSHTILIRYCTALSPCGKWYATVTAKKTLLLRETRSWSLISERNIERRPSKIIFTPKSDYVILTDKTGDVYSYAITNPSEKGKFLLGHVSVILDVLVTPDEKFLITCDRDEKIRVSHYPNTYNICSFCLGHTEYVIKIIMLNSETLVSASGDGTLKFWNYRDGKELLTHSVYHDIHLDKCDNSTCINDMSAVFQSEQGLCFCVSVNKLSKILVYKVTDDDLSVTCVQKIDTYTEPLCILLSAVGLLWILITTESGFPFIKAMIWNNGCFSPDIGGLMENSLREMNELLQNSKLGSHKNNLHNLFKNAKLAASNFKRIKN